MCQPLPSATCVTGARTPTRPSALDGVAAGPAVCGVDGIELAVAAALRDVLATRRTVVRVARRGTVVATVGASDAEPSDADPTDADPTAADPSAVELEPAPAVASPGMVDPSNVVAPGGAAVIGTRVANAAAGIRSTRMARYPSVVPPTTVTIRAVDSSTKAHR